MTTAWQAVSSTRIGSTHVRDGRPNQDAHTTTSYDDSAVIAVADGHGHHLHFRSEVGSALAAGAAQRLLEEALPGFVDVEQTNAYLREVLGPTLIAHWVTAVRADVEAHPYTPEELELVREGDQGALRPYGSTVVAMAANAHVFVAVQLGDGDAIAVSGSGEVFRPLPEDELLHGMATTSLCQEDPLASLRTIALDAGDVALGYVCTDGFGRPRVDTEGWWSQVGSELLERTRAHGLPWVAERLPGWLTEPAEYGGDDVTLALLTRSTD